jgi:hypothetical protein
VIRTEEELIELLTAHGFDFTSTAGQIAQRFPIQLDWGLASFPIIPFELSRPLAGGLVWKIPTHGVYALDVPPRNYFHEYHPTPDARRNHDEAEARLTALFGPGEKGASVNVYERFWQIGFFRVRVITWPHELNRSLRNEFEGRNPYLWMSATIRIEPALPFIHKTEDATAPMRLLLTESADVSILCDSEVYTRRNRVPALTATHLAGLSVSNEFLVRTSECTLRIPLEQIQSLEHSRVFPARGPGHSDIYLNTMFLNRHPVRVRVFAGKETESLDHIARELARALSKPLSVDESEND